jgi:hypothetical protein
MGYNLKKGTGNWTQFRNLPNVIEVDFHDAEYGRRTIPYESAMYNVWCRALTALKEAYQAGRNYVLFTHGSSTSRLGKTTARSQVRQLMRSPEATPYIRRSACIQHDTVFVAAIRPNPDAVPTESTSSALRG